MQSYIPFETFEVLVATLKLLASRLIGATGLGIVVVGEECSGIVPSIIIGRGGSPKPIFTKKIQYASITFTNQDDRR